VAVVADRVPRAPRGGGAGSDAHRCLVRPAAGRWQTLWLLPLAWIALTGLKPEPEIIRLPIRWLPVHATTENFGIALTTTRTANVGRAFFNSTFVAVAETLLILAVDAARAYAAGVAEFRGRRSSSASRGEPHVPVQITLVPLTSYSLGAGWLKQLSGVDPARPLAGLGVFLMRQFSFCSKPATSTTRPGWTEPGRLRSSAGRSAAGQARASRRSDLHVPAQLERFHLAADRNLEQ